MIVLLETFDPIQADFLKTQLEEAGIAAHIHSADVNGLRPSLAFVSPIQVLVLESARKEALGILKDLGLA
jgi:hypothetical protein